MWAYIQGVQSQRKFYCMEQLHIWNDRKGRWIYFQHGWNQYDRVFPLLGESHRKNETLQKTFNKFLIYYAGQIQRLVCRWELWLQNIVPNTNRKCLQHIDSFDEQPFCKTRARQHLRLHQLQFVVSIPSRALSAEIIQIRFSEISSIPKSRQILSWICLERKRKIIQEQKIDRHNDDFIESNFKIGLIAFAWKIVIDEMNCSTNSTDLSKKMNSSDLSFQINFMKKSRLWIKIFQTLNSLIISLIPFLIDLFLFLSFSILN